MGKVQSHDIGDTFLGIYALEKAFGARRAWAICSCRQEQERFVCVGVWSFRNQSQDRLQVAAALSGRRVKSFGGCVASAALPRENASFCLANTVAQSAAGAPALGSKKVAPAAAKSFSSSLLCSGGEHVGALAGGAAFGKEAQAKGAAWSGVAVEGSTRTQRLQPGVDNRLQGLVSHGRWVALRAADGARSLQSLCASGGSLAQPKRCSGAPGDEASFSSLRSAQSYSVDNGAPFGGKGALGLSRLSVWWLRLGIGCSEPT
jgi:hypothetical protein